MLLNKYLYISRKRCTVYNAGTIKTFLLRSLFASISFEILPPCETAKQLLIFLHKFLQRNHCIIVAEL